MGKLDNTLIIYIGGDNGTSAEGTLVGTPNQMTAYNGILTFPVAEQLKFYDVWGSDEDLPAHGGGVVVGVRHAVQVDQAGGVALRRHAAGHGDLVARPHQGRRRHPHQFHHVIDIVPTILEATGIPAPEMVNGIAQKPIEGVSMAYTFDKANANAPSTRKTQYFEMIGNRGDLPRRLDRRHDAAGRRPGCLATGKLPDVQRLQVGAVQPRRGLLADQRPRREDAGQAEGDAGALPDRGGEVQRASAGQLDASRALLAPRPSATAGRTVFTYSGENAGIPVGNAPSILDRSYTITAEVDVPQGGGEGMIATLGGRFGGYGLYLLKGKPVFVYNLLDLERFRWEGGVGERDWLGSALTPGKHTIVFDFKYDGPGLGKGGTGVLKVDGKEVARQTIPHTIPFLMSIDETFDVGVDTRTPVDDRLPGAVPLHRQDRQADLQARAGADDGRGARGDAESARQSARLGRVRQRTDGWRRSVRRRRRSAHLPE